MPDPVTLAQAAEILAVDVQTVYILVRQGDIAGIKTVSGWYLNRADVLAYKELH